MARAMPMSMICDIAHCLEANPTPIFNKGGCGLETYPDDGTPREAGYVLCPAVKPCNTHIFTIDLYYVEKAKQHKLLSLIHVWNKPFKAYQVHQFLQSYYVSAYYTPYFVRTKRFV